VRDKRALIRIQDDVRSAIECDYPVVALESALITHGLPYPQNLETARAMEHEVRNAGAVPATIAVLDGKICVGLSDTEQEELTKTTAAIKVSSRGLAYAVATRRTAGTPVSGTMWIANHVGIRFFGTGGLGGVHFGASETGDISTDLTEMSRTPVTVVSSGVKSILDIGRTLEFLETVGVPVFGFKTDAFPAFYSGSSGFNVSERLNSATEAAHVCAAHRELGLPSGILIACPPPILPQDEQALASAIEQANDEARNQQIHGGDVTPFVLRRVAELTNDMSVDVNIALLKNNAKIAADIAVAASSLNDRST
jgi:pseudouridylate synthase